MKPTWSRDMFSTSDYVPQFTFNFGAEAGSCYIFYELRLKAFLRC